MPVFYHSYTELAGANCPVTVFPRSCSMQPGPMPSSAKQALSAVYFPFGCVKADMKRKGLCPQFWGLPGCNHMLGCRWQR